MFTALENPDRSGFFFHEMKFHEKLAPTDVGAAGRTNKRLKQELTICGRGRAASHGCGKRPPRGRALLFHGISLGTFFRGAHTRVLKIFN
jgi:hypothetical protein